MASDMCHAFKPKSLNRLGANVRNGFFNRVRRINQLQIRGADFPSLRHFLEMRGSRFAEPIQITPRDRDVAERACRTCHEEIVLAITVMHRCTSRTSGSAAET